MGWRAAVSGLSEPGYNGGDERGVVMQRWRCPIEVVGNEGGGRSVSGGRLSDTERRLVQGYFCEKNPSEDGGLTLIVLPRLGLTGGALLTKMSVDEHHRSAFGWTLFSGDICERVG